MIHFGIDLDGVCFDWQEFVNWHNSVYNTDFTKEIFLNLDFPDRFGIPLNILQRRVDRMYKTVGLRNLLPASGAVSAMRELSQIGKTSIITSRPPWAKEDTFYWVRAYFNRDITGEVHFAKNQLFLSTTSQLQTKSEICAREKINYLIDDDPHHAVPAADSGVQTLLFDYYGNSLKSHRNIHLVYSWPEAVKKIKELERL